MRWPKALAKSLLKNFISCAAAFERYCKDSTCVFLYHDVTDRPSEFSVRYGLNVPPALFERQIAWIRKRFHVISPHQLVSGDHPRPAALVTFDDGMPGYFENALPVLARTRTPSTIFLNMEPVDGGVFWAGLITYLCDFDEGFRLGLPRQEADGAPLFLRCRKQGVLDYLARADREGLLRRVRSFHGGFASRDQVARAAGSADVHYGSHLYNHYNAATLSDQELSEAFLANQRELEAFPNYTRLFSYPFGRPKLCYNDRTHGILRGLGAKTLFSAYPLPNFALEGGLVHRIGLDEGVTDEDELLLRVLLPLLRRRLARRAPANDARRKEDN